MMRLHQSLAARAPEAPLWRGSRGWRSTREVLDAARLLALRLDEPRLAFALRDDESLAIALLAAELRGTTALLVPASWGQQMIETYLPRAGMRLLVTDRNDLSAPALLRFDATPPAVGALSSPGAASSPDTRWIVPTSGTTGEPKLVEHTLESLARTVKTDGARGAGLTWGLVYELGRFAGLQVLLQAILGGSRLVFADRAGGVDALVTSLADAGCNALSATPTLWRRILMAEAAGRLPLTVATLGGEIADAAILRALAARYPAAKLLHIYASTEAGVGFSVADGQAGFPVAFITRPPRGVELKVDDTGRLWLRPAAAVQRFLGETRALVEADGWIDTGDQVSREGDRYVFLGRANGAINVGGNKVFPEEVENCIRAVDGVQLTAVRARANPIMGALVEALVRPDPLADRATLKRSITTACRAKLAPYKVPALVTWVDDLAVSPAGKLVRS